MKLTDILYDLEFDYKVNEDNTLTLIDLQGANLGGIEQEKFLQMETNEYESIEQIYLQYAIMCKKLENTKIYHYCIEIINII